MAKTIFFFKTVVISHNEDSPESDLWLSHAYKVAHGFPTSINLGDGKTMWRF